LLATVGNEVGVIAKKATQSTPIVFVVSQDPVRLGLVASLARPGGNVTGINFFSGELVGKHLASSNIEPCRFTRNYVTVA
jgi:putative ABC transport system substrate-binding protein